MILEWDSAFFGMRVAQIMANEVHERKLAMILSSMTAAGVKVAYWGADPVCSLSQNAALACGGFLADRKTTFAKEINGEILRTNGLEWEVEEYVEATATPEMEKLALEAGRQSRFRIDPCFSDEHWSSLYQQWIQSSTSREAADAVFVVPHHGELVAFVSVKNADNISQIGLIAVSPDMRGKGIGRALIHAAEKWTRQRRLPVLRVVTQGDNLSACELYTKCGFFREKTEHIYHFWLK